MKTLWTGLIAATVLMTAAANADDAKHPVKVSAAEAGGPIFDSPKAVKNNKRGPVTNYTIGTSEDKKFVAGLFKAAQSDTPIESYPDDEFCYFLSGSVTLTSADGTAVTMNAGETVLIPKGWKGRWTTPGYTKYYVIYK